MPSTRIPLDSIRHGAVQPKVWIGILFLISGMWTLSLLDSSSKWLSAAGYHVVMISWVRFITNILFASCTLVPLYQRRTQKSIFHTRHLRLQITRGAVLVLCTLLFFSMLKIMPIAEATVMNFCAPLIVLAVSPWILNEPSRISRWIAVVIGFIGMIIVIRPGGDIPLQGVFLGLVSASAFAAFSILNRKLGQKEDPTVTLFYGGITGIVLTSMLVPFFWTAHSPTAAEITVFASMGITSTLGHFFLNFAYKNAEASFLMPFTYLQVISASTLGWLIFHQFPDMLTLVGIGIICTSGAGITYYEYYCAKKSRRLRA